MNTEAAIDWFAIWDSCNDLWAAMPKYRYFNRIEDALSDLQEQIVADWLKADPKGATFFLWDQAQDGGSFDLDQQGQFLSAWEGDEEVEKAAADLFLLYGDGEGTDPDGERTQRFYELMETRGYKTKLDDQRSVG